MTTTKLKTGIVSAIVAASVVTPLVVQHQAQARLRDQDGALRQRADQLAKLQADKQQLSKLLAAAKNSRPLSNDQLSELMRLRGEVGLLRKDLQELSQPKANAPLSRTDVLASMEKMHSEQANKLKQLLETNPSEKIPELKYLNDSSWLWIVANQTLDTEEDCRSAMSSARGVATSMFGVTLHRALGQYAKGHNGQFPSDLSQLQLYFQSPVDDAILQRWEILPARKLPSHLVRHLEVDEEWVITQKAPVNEALDQRIVFGLKSMDSYSGTNVWVRVP